MKANINPAVVAAVIVVIVVIAGILIFKNAGPSGDGPSKPQSMAQHVDKGSSK